jgi:ATP-binding cassette subfamily F protein 3
MSLLNINNVTKYHGADLILRDVNFQVSRGEKVALVGPNGAGKSTLLKIIAGSEPYDEGMVNVQRGRRVAYLAQEPIFQGEQTLWQTMESALSFLNELQAELRRLEQHISDTSAPDWQETMERYGELATRFEHADGYNMQQRIERTLHGLGFSKANYHHRVTKLSGGQKTRAALAATLLSEPDLLLLDEPTNHLDLQALEWLDGFLKSWEGTLIVTSHDRYFLDRVTKRTLDVSFGQIDDYPASYNHFLTLKAERLERMAKEYEAQQAFIARTEAFIQRYKAGQRSKEAKGREKRLNRLKEEQQLDRPQDQKTIHMALGGNARSGERVVAFDKVEIGYQNPQQHSDRDALLSLFRLDKLEIHRGERVALLGPNGSGKTTLLRTLIGEHYPLDGTIHLGHNVTMGYYAQGHEHLTMGATLIEELQRVGGNIPEERARSLLARFLFYGDDVFKRVGDLSGGERNRVALAQLTLLSANFLIMDEPTNHLDIQAREALEEVLQEYNGTILFVSHDRMFIDALADKVWMVEQNRLVEYLGGYTDFYEKYTKRQEQQKQQKVVTKQQKREQIKRIEDDEKQRKKQLADIETEIEQLETELTEVKAALEEASNAQDVEEINVEQITDLGTRYGEIETRLNVCYETWAELAEEQSE